MALVVALVITGDGTDGGGGVPVGQGDGSSRTTVFVGVSGLRWQDVSVAETPNMATLLEGAAGALSTRTVANASCPADGWVTVSAGRRAKAPGSDPAACAFPTSLLPEGSDPVLPGWADVSAAAAGDGYDAVPGSLGDALADAGVPTSGIGPGAAIALAGSGGSSARWQGLGDDVGATIRKEMGALGSTGLIVVDLGGVPGARGEASGRGDRTEAVRSLDSRLGEVLAALPAQANVVVASLADSSSSPSLGALTVRGPGVEEHAFLSSPSTRQPALIQLTDIAPTLLASVGVERPASMVGAVVTVTRVADSSSQRLAELRDLDDAAQAINRVVAPFVIVFFAPVLALYAWCWWMRSRSGLPWPGWVGRTSQVVALIPAATFLANSVPWWRADWQSVAVCATVVAWTALLTLPLLALWRWRASGQRVGLIGLGWAGAVTMEVLGLDVVSGSRLQLSSLIGVQPLLGGRFYGLGNPAFGLLATGTLMLAATAAAWILARGRRHLPVRADGSLDPWSRPARVATATVLSIGVVGIALDAMPGWGSDFGGPPAFLPAVALLALRVWGVEITWRRVIAVGAVTLAVLIAICVVDWLRPPQQRTHLGNVVQTVLDGELLPVIGRKLATNWALLTSSPITLATPVVAVLVGWRLLRPTRGRLPVVYRAHPGLAHLVEAWLLLLAVAFVLNDSGVVIPPVAGVLFLPALVGVVTTWRVNSSTEPDPADTSPTPVPPVQQ